MKRRRIQLSASRSIALVVVLLAAILQAKAQDTQTPYPNMPPIEQYLMRRPEHGDRAGAKRGPAIHLPRCHSYGPWKPRL